MAYTSKPTLRPSEKVGFLLFKEQLTPKSLLSAGVISFTVYPPKFSLKTNFDAFSFGSLSAFDRLRFSSPSLSEV